MILPARRPSSPPNPRGISTSQRSFLAAHRPPRPHGKDERLRESERRWRWPVVWLAVALAACSAPLGLGTQLSPDAAQPLANASTAPTLLPSAPPPGRAVATMPSSRLGTGSIQPIVVHGDESPTAGSPKSSGVGGNNPADVTLNFSGADIRDVINAVLGETLKLNYVIDPEVSGPVTFNVSRPISRDEVLSTLEAVLNSRGATMVQSDGIIRVMPLRREGKTSAPAPFGGGPMVQAAGQRTEVFPLRFIGATDMERV